MAPMLSVIVETADAGDRLPALLAALTSAAVEGLPAKIRLKAGWLELLARHLRGGGRDAVIVGEGGFLGEKPFGVLIGQAAAAGLAHPDLKRLRGQLGRGAVRLA
jgi:hypothetical protein